jgi:hypothetical protein
MIASCAAFILFVSMSVPPQPPQAWVPNGEFTTQQSCRRAAQQLGYTNGRFRCVPK